MINIKGVFLLFFITVILTVYPLSSHGLPPLPYVRENSIDISKDEKYLIKLDLDSIKEDNNGIVFFETIWIPIPPEQENAARGLGLTKKPLGHFILYYKADPSRNLIAHIRTINYYKDGSIARDYTRPAKEQKLERPKSNRAKNTLKGLKDNLTIENEAAIVVSVPTDVVVAPEERWEKYETEDASVFHIPAEWEVLKGSNKTYSTELSTPNGAKLNVQKILHAQKQEDTLEIGLFRIWVTGITSPNPTMRDLEDAVSMFNKNRT
jgi:hypothetical protein